MEQTSIKLPADFETYGEARKAGFLRMKQLKDQGARVVGMFCSFVPTELVYAAGALPVGLCAFTEEPIPAAEANLPRNLCPLIKASYGFALTDTCLTSTSPTLWWVRPPAMARRRCSSC